ncbi:MAG TPA: iron-containing alcohol dehydrogenase [Verrucomicrobiae bacterium]
MRFEFATAGRIVFGAGSLREAGPLAREFGGRALMVTGRDPHRASALAAALESHGIVAVSYAVAGEPEVRTVEAGTALGREKGCGMVIGFGGGSAIDAGKAIAAMLTNDGSVLDYLEVIGRGKTLARPAAPFIAIPTTAGTGSEVTRNAVLTAPEHQVKVSLRSALMLPRIALVDPELTCGLSPALTAATGLDALTQLIEPYVSSRANPMTDPLCLDGIRRVARSLRAACRDGQNKAAREDMSLASLFGGLALANAGLGAVHGFAGPLGGMYPAPHGAVCAALLAQTMESNLRALRQRQPHAEALRRFQEVARVLTGQPDAVAEEGVDWVRRLVEDLGIPRLRAYGVTAAHVNELVDKAAKASSMKANPIVLTREELAGILRAAL